GYGSDSYHFRAGHGKDTIYDYYDSKADTLVFEGATADNLTIEKVGNDLLIHAYGTDDTVTVHSYFSNAAARTFSIVLDDKTLSVEDIAAMGFPVYGSARNDNLSGWNNADTLFGYDGNDSLSGNGGDDILDGGAGNDNLDGGAGNDTYRFQAGHGKDTITDNATSSINSLVFDGANASDVILEKFGNDLVIRAYNSEDSVTLHSFFSQANYQRFSLTFSDRTLPMDELLSLGFSVPGSDNYNYLEGWKNGDNLMGYTGNDTLHGNGGDDNLNGGAGDDTLNGNDGNDTLDGGTGNDRLDGGAGYDTYRFQAGHGRDTITDNATSAINTLSFENASSHNVGMERSGNNLIIHAYGSNDSVTINSYFSSTNYRRLQLEFENETIDMDELADFVTETLAKGNKSTLQGQRNTSDTSEADTSEETLWFAQGNDITLEDVNTQAKAAVQDSVVTETTTEAQLQQLIDAMASFGEVDTSGSGLSVNTRLNENSYTYLVTPQ
ncbi:hypothetical protein MXL54_22265, partial [Enterobacteriaceae bacterium G50]|nr:hypothetical protein [Enterobacteriaceae bacterium G50]